MRIIFMGTPDFSVPVLDAILEAGHEVAAVYSQPPRPAGRGKKDRPSPVQLCAERHGLRVNTPLSLRKIEPRKAFVELKADVAVVVAYGLILPPKILAGTTHGCLNLHGSILPRWRGAAPIQRAVMAGDTQSGVDVMRMEEGLDTGPVCLRAKTLIDANMTAGELYDALMELGAPLMVEALALLDKGELICTPQPDAGVTYAAKIEKAESRIDWSRNAREVHNHIRGLSPFPGAWFELEVNGKIERVKVLQSELSDESGAPDITPGTLLDDQLSVACGTKSVRLTRLQRAGKRAMNQSDFTRGLPMAAGARLL